MAKHHQKTVEQTKAFLETALLELLETEYIDDITVTDLCQQAEVGRKSFYRHYTSIENVLDGWFEKQAAEYTACLSAAENQKPVLLTSLIQDFYTFWYQRKNQLAVICKNAPYGTICTHLSKYAAASARKRTDLDLKYLPLFGVSGLCCLLEEWASENFQTPPDIFIHQIIEELKSVSDLNSCLI